MRSGLIALSALVVLVFGAPPARAQAPAAPLVQSGAEQVTATDGGAYSASMDGTNTHTDPATQVILPQLKTTAGADVTIALGDGPYERVSALLANAEVPITSIGGGLWKLTVTPGLVLPLTLSVQVDSKVDQTMYGQRWMVDLVSAYQAPITYPAPGPTVMAPPAMVTAGSLKLTGRRLSITLTCSSEAYEPCHGGVWLRATPVRVGRIPFEGVAPGTQRTLRYTVPAATLRSMRRHHTKAISAVVTSPGWPAVTTRLALPSAHAASAEGTTVATTQASAHPDLVDYCERSGPHLTCGGGGSTRTTELLAVQGDSVTITFADDVEKVSARLGKLRVTPTRVAPGVYSFPLPPSVTLPVPLSISESHASGDSKWELELVGRDAPRLYDLWFAIDWSDLDIKLDCPGGCDGTLTLRGGSKRLARIKLDGVTHKQLHAKISRAGQRYLERHQAPEITARLKTRGRPVIRTSNLGPG